MKNENEIIPAEQFLEKLGFREIVKPPNKDPFSPTFQRGTVIQILREYATHILGVLTPTPPAESDVCVCGHRIKPKVIVLCGSSKFVDVMAVCAWLLERDEHAITMGLHLLPAWYSVEPIPDHLAEHENVRQEMDDLHKRKIDIADEIFIVNVSDYIGSSTRSEVEYAEKLGKKIRWYQQDIIREKVEIIASKTISESPKETPKEQQVKEEVVKPCKNERTIDICKHCGCHKDGHYLDKRDGNLYCSNLTSDKRVFCPTTIPMQPQAVKGENKWPTLLELHGNYISNLYINASPHLRPMMQSQGCCR